MMDTIVFWEPKEFGCGKDIINAIDNTKIIHVNLEGLDSKIRQRVLDFVGGAAYIKEAKIIKSADNTYLVVPKTVKCEFTNKKVAPKTEIKELKELKVVDEEEEIKQSFY